MTSVVAQMVLVLSEMRENTLALHRNGRRPEFNPHRAAVKWPVSTDVNRHFN